MISFTVRIGVRGPNLREHWAQRAKRVAAERACVQGCALVQLKPAGLRALRSLPRPIRVRLVRIGVRALDSDNAVAACKGIRDEVAVLLGLDDGPTSPVSWEVTQEKGRPSVRVEVWSAEEGKAA